MVPLLWNLIILLAQFFFCFNKFQNGNLYASFEVDGTLQQSHLSFTNHFKFATCQLFKQCCFYQISCEYFLLLCLNSLSRFGRFDIFSFFVFFFGITRKFH